jgi:hypothetical protein
MQQYRYPLERTTGVASLLRWRGPELVKAKFKGIKW